MKKLLTMLLSLLLLPGAAFAEIPMSFTHQGRIYEEGQPVNDVYRKIGASIYSGEGESAQEIANAEENLKIMDGFYSITISGIDPEQVKTAAALFLAIKIEDKEMEPRLPIQAVPYALVSSQAITADSAKNSDHAQLAESALFAEQAGSSTYAQKLGSDTVTMNAGNSTTPVFIQNGEIVAATPYADASVAQAAALSSISLGNSTTPVYFNNGKPVAAISYDAATVAEAKKLSTSAGNSTTPVYFNNGKPIAAISYASATVGAAKKLSCTDCIDETHLKSSLKSKLTDSSFPLAGMAVWGKYCSSPSQVSGKNIWQCLDDYRVTYNKTKGNIKSIEQKTTHSNTGNPTHLGLHVTFSTPYTSASKYSAEVYLNNRSANGEDGTDGWGFFVRISNQAPNGFDVEVYDVDGDMNGADVLAVAGPTAEYKNKKMFDLSTGKVTTTKAQTYNDVWNKIAGSKNSLEAFNSIIVKVYDL